ncbi:MAG: cytochrome C [Gemmobacter sp.]
MKTMTLAAIASAALALPALAQDIANGEKEFGKCTACHAIIDDDGEVIKRGGRVGPNLYGIIGRPAGAVEGFRYSPALAAAGEQGLVWDIENFDVYSQDTTAFLREYLGDSKARSLMTFKLRSGGDDIAAYIASLSDATE